jgi:hypothetical protein
MGQASSFCWQCGRVNGVHHPTCVNHPNNIATNPVPPLALEPQEVLEDGVPPVKKQRCVRTCLTVWVSILCSFGLLCIALAIFFASQVQNTFNPFQQDNLREAATACGIIGAALAVPGIILSITWCSAFCCCKKRWICGCCR